MRNLVGQKDVVREGKIEALVSVRSLQSRRKKILRNRQTRERITGLSLPLHACSFSLESPSGIWVAAPLLLAGPVIRGSPLPQRFRAWELLENRNNKK